MRGLTIKAGRSAFTKIKQHGLSPASVRTVVGASGGAKWLVLRHIDRVIFGEWLTEAEQKIDLVGSSIGAWRMTLAAMKDPEAEWQRFEEGYISWRSSPGMTVDDMTRETWRTVRELFPEDKIKEVLSNPLRNLNIVAVKCKGMAAADHYVPLGLSTLAAAGANLINRQGLKLFYDRAVFHSHDKPIAGLAGFNRQDIRLTENNLTSAITASSSIPFVMHGVRDFEGANDGVYRDGGFTDYHFDEPWDGGGGVVLYPHFYDHLIPGWFDKSFKSRRTKPAALGDVVLISPSQSFIESLPGGKIPDRRDFRTMDNDERIKYWQTVLGDSRRLGDELAEMLQDHGKLMDTLSIVE